MLNRLTAKAATTDALTISGLSVAYGDKPALNAVDARFSAGAMSAIVGPNGAGKSTLLKAAMGMIPSIDGTVRFLGEPLSAVRRRVAYVPQRLSVDWDFPATVIDVVLMGLYGRLGAFAWIGQKERQEALACLKEVDLDDLADRQIGQLSGGQQQRVFIARALAQNADLLILDEPLAGVDAATERLIVALLRRLAGEGRAVIAVHHDLSTVREYYDDVLILNGATIANGSVEAAFTEANLARAYGGRLTAGPLAPTGARA
ncbi:metal ABC transporter ATP-binding protein [Pararhizobium haloflavum]|uniref:metal ABC transporter ATP-binding protein n=1 Tax=Pararhizobium haloflavum TaxID=2037914 RepID=UPI000C1983DC|nr:metal ABC transporter ATP-binding protein [Pararhizobium haloflavum]